MFLKRRQNCHSIHQFVLISLNLQFTYFCFSYTDMYPHFFCVLGKIFAAVFAFAFRENLCCGVVFRGPNREILIDPRFFKPCRARLAMCKLQASATAKVESDGTSKVYSDSSSDSGYDESSNPGCSSLSTFKSGVSISQLDGGGGTAVVAAAN